MGIAIGQMAMLKAVLETETKGTPIYIPSSPKNERALIHNSKISVLQYSMNFVYESYIYSYQRRKCFSVEERTKNLFYIKNGKGVKGSNKKSSNHRTESAKNLSIC